MSAKKEGRKEVKQKGIADGVPVYCAHDKIVQTVQLIPNPANPNKHPDDQIKMLAKIIKASGWRQPITVSNRSGYIVKGHGRLMAAQLAGLDEVPVDFQDYATEAEEYADLIADNRIAELSEIDNKLLADVFAEIDTGEIDLDQTGYTETEIEQIITQLAGSIHDELEADKDDAPAAKPVTQQGDLWILGKHRVMCGDCTNKADRAALLNGANPKLLLTNLQSHSEEQQPKRECPNLLIKALDGHTCSLALIYCQEDKKAQEPVELFESIIESAESASGVYDPFGGSGSTLEAAEKQGQQSYIMELTPAYTDTIVRRYIQLTGDTDISCIRNGKELQRKEWERLLAAGGVKPAAGSGEV